MPDGSSAPLQGARPSIEIDGQRNATVTSAMQELLIVDSVDGLARCEFKVGNWGGPEHPGFQYFGRDTLDFGKSLKVTLADSALFEGRISAIAGEFPDGGPPQVCVCAEDRLQDLRMTRRTRGFEDVALADVVQRIASDHGLSPQTDLSGETYKLLAQVNQSDLAFLRDLARREDAEVWVEGTRLKAAQRARRNGGRLALSWAGLLHEFSVCADLAHQRTQLIAAGWNVADKREAKYTAGEAAVQSELNGGTSGASTLRQAFGERIDTLAHGMPASDAQAQVLAEASFRHHARRFLVGRGVAQTQAGLQVGAKITISGIGPLFEGDYFVTNVSTRFDAKKGLRTEFLCDRPAIGHA